MYNEQDHAELGLPCVNICGVLDQGMDGMNLDDLSRFVRGAINRLTTWVRQSMPGSTGGTLQSEIDALRDEIKALKDANKAALLLYSQTGDAPQSAVEVLRKEVKALKDANRALSLYAAKILDRIIAAKGFEHALADDSNGKVGPTPAKPTSNSLSGGGFTGMRRTSRRGRRSDERSSGRTIRSAGMGQSAHDD